MSTFPTSRIGLHLTPATATWAAPMAAYYLFLQNRVVYHRLKAEKYMGDTADESQATRDPLYVSTRAQLNFIENVPLALIVALIAELNGANRKYIHYGLGALLAARISHAEFGLLRPESLGLGRPLGYYCTQSVIAGLAGYLAYLVRDYWM